MIGKPVAAIAAEVMAGKPLADFKLENTKLGHVAVKEAVYGEETTPVGRLLEVTVIWDLPNAVKLKNTIVESRPTHFLFNITVFILKGPLNCAD